MYHQGHGVAQDYKEALRLYHLATEQGYAPAQYNLGVLWGKRKTTFPYIKCA
jgi:TPR repeat protein